MKNLLGMSYNKMSDLFSRWNKGDLDSFLIEITADILSRSDPETGQPMVEVILDRAGQKGTGKWTTQSALDLGVAAPTVAEAVFARCISSMKDERVAASRLIHGPTERFSGDINEFARRCTTPSMPRRSAPTRRASAFSWQRPPSRSGVSISGRSR